MTIEPGTYIAKFDIDGNGKADEITFTISAIGKGEVNKLQGSARLDNGQVVSLGSAVGHTEAVLNFTGKNGAATGNFSIYADQDGLGAVSFKGTEAHTGWYDLNTGKAVDFFPDIRKFRNEYDYGAYDVSRSFGVTKQ